ncbi:hypothetical protein CCZ01_09755 [Helicobacter monodelphidis]|uniref:hypothetical protein n=1 Tax=Helicobacter sp. 15-1451 TaxID=2004995 RepID=UPI000DCF38DA|nr:hypothetical protein [Helicobacter sp. 15-1451]RAX56219.1 hypothetical protein CCZ01_09755 [Helicobacter sp. 15-1451]
MATFMEKDVLLELVSGTLAYIRSETTQQAECDRVQLKDIRENIWITSCEELDYQKLVTDIKNIRIKYEDSNAK